MESTVCLVIGLVVGYLYGIVVMCEYLAWEGITFDSPQASETQEVGSGPFD